MKACEHWLEQLRACVTDDDFRQVVRSVQADTLRSTRDFSISEHEFVLSMKLEEAAKALLSQGGSPTPLGGGTRR